MHSRPFLLALALAAPAIQAQQATAVPWMTGERLVKRLQVVMPADVTWSAKSAMPSRELVAESTTH
jgi:hypothetical protein